ncbi:MAG: ATP-binding cassette domain-containing protein [Clostridia bacterium]|nr:ATP-binding cassette domain-containing protein [Clostridia bacterium]
MVEVSNLVKAFGSKLAVDDISFSVGDGEILGFLGPNGAGKSTTLNIMTGYLSANSGTVKIGGIDILEKPDEAKKQIGFLPEQPPLYPDMTVDEYLGFVYELKNCKYNRKKHLEEVCQVTKLSDVRGRVIKNLSKGYKQRVGIAQALIGNPKVLIFDEPTVGLDPKQIIEVRNLIRTLGREHTVILSTHILSEVQAVCDRIVIINGGKILCDKPTDSVSSAINKNSRYKLKICGPQREVMTALREAEGVEHVEVTSEREKDSCTFIVESSGTVDIRKSVFYKMSENNWPIIGMAPEGLSLEEVFMKLTDEAEPVSERSKRRGRKA